ncbi:unnamed protein product, partial [Hapterophycus canaliculatus]
GGLIDSSLGSAFKKDRAGVWLEASKAGEGGDVDAFELGGDEDGARMGMEIGDGMDDFGGGFEPDLNLDDGLAPDMQASSVLSPARQDGGELDLGGGINDLEASRDNTNDHDDGGDGGGDGGGDKDDATAAAAGGRSDSGGALRQHKWHPHTVKVLKLVQKQLKAPRSPGVTHASLTRGAKRRTAAGAFFELLQV